MTTTHPLVFCLKHGICVTAHTPLGGAGAKAGWVWPKKYKKTVAQIALRWGIQRNTVVIPKLSKLERLKENFQVFDFELSKEDMELIGSICRKYRTNQPAVFWGIDLYA
ncbi:NADP-dependent D-sorbitol-6-phosphate dehydrogenase-like [Glycine soja]|uniref:NADP-dependent D-sorbitol-6-phosphate dehydrogenase-like n=1 Tax=Glycine soja TaxID=3848 RepID=UPI00103FB006|nr:NADP-dependent D-sorbitol-6-phosphate dehydrogenase-like [Glycine soja]